MSPYLLSADHAAVDQGAARAAALAPSPPVTYLFAEYAAAVARRDKRRVAEIRLAADPGLLDELDGFDYPAAA